MDRRASRSSAALIIFLAVSAALVSPRNAPGLPTGGPIQPGCTATGTIVGPAFLEAWTFSGVAGERVIVAAVATSGALDTEVILYPPGGGPAEVRSICDAYGCRDRLDHQLLSTGLYTVVVQDRGLNDAGLYKITVLRIPVQVVCPGEPDGGAVSSGETGSGAIDGAADIDAYQFQGVSGQRLIVGAVTTSGTLDTRVAVYPGNGGPVVAQSTCDAYGCRDRIEYQLQATGLYTILIEDNGLNDAGAYQMSLLLLPAGPLTYPGDPDGGDILSGETRSGQMQARSDFDAFQFDGQGGRRVIVAAVTTSGALDTRIFIYPDTGGPAVAQSTCDAYGCSDRIEYQLQAAGTYTVVIEDNGNNDSGQYTMAVLVLPDGPLASAADPDGGPLGSGATCSGAIEGAADLDAYQVYGKSGDRLITAAVRTSQTLDTRIVIYPQSGGAAVAQSTCDAYGCRDRIEYRLQSDGLYTVVIEDNGLDSPGDYRLTMLKLPGATTYTADGDGGTFSPAANEVFGAYFNHASDMDAFHFYADPGDRVLVSAVRANGAVDTKIVLYPEGGGPAGAQSICDAYGCRDQIDVQLASGGLFTIVVEDNGLDSQGSYRCSLTRIPPADQPGLYHPHPPEGGVVTVENPGSFTWDAVGGATGYDLYFASAVTEPLVLIAANLPGPFHAIPAIAPDQSHYWHVEAFVPGDTLRGPVWNFYAIHAVGLPGAPAAPGLALEAGPSRPNPFNPLTTIPFSIPRRGMVSLSIYDVAGRLVRVLVEKELPRGEHRAEWNGTNESAVHVPGAVYFYELRMDGESRRGKVVLVN